MIITKLKKQNKNYSPVKAQLKQLKDGLSKMEREDLKRVVLAIGDQIKTVAAKKSDSAYAEVLWKHVALKWTEKSSSLTSEKLYKIFQKMDNDRTASSSAAPSAPVHNGAASSSASKSEPGAAQPSQAPHHHHHLTLSLPHSSTKRPHDSDTQSTTSAVATSDLPPTKKPNVAVDPPTATAGEGAAPPP